MSGIFNKIFFAGALGGASPEIAKQIVRLQNGETLAWLNKITDHQDGTEKVMILCAVALIISLFLIGGIVTVMMQETEPRKAFILGISAPAFILSTYASASSTNDTGKVGSLSNETSFRYEQLFHDIMFAKASAQDTSLNGQVVQFDFSAVENFCTGCQLVLTDQSGQNIGSIALPSNQTSFSAAIPGDAKTARIIGLDATNSIQFPVQDFGVIPSDGKVIVTRERNYWNDLQYSLGNSSISPYDTKLAVGR